MSFTYRKEILVRAHQDRVVLIRQLSKVEIRECRALKPIIKPQMTPVSKATIPPLLWIVMPSVASSRNKAETMVY